MNADRVPKTERTLGDAAAVWSVAALPGICRRCGSVYLDGETITEDNNGIGWIAQRCCGTE